MHDGYPLHRLNTGQMYAWLFSPIIQKQMTSWLGKHYRTGVVILSPGLKAFAKVAPTGQVTAIPKPWHRFEFWQIDNKPSFLYGECACRNYIDPETGGKWGDRDKERGLDIHHPFCQCRQTAQVVFDRSKEAADARVKDGRAPQARLDEWAKAAEELGARRGQ